MGAYAEELHREANEGPSERPARAPLMYLHRDREGAGSNLWRDYFCETPTFPPHKFKRHFRMRSQIFLRIIQGISECSLDPLPAHFDFFKQRPDTTGRQGFNIYQMCTSALRQLAYGTTGDMFDEYLHMSEQTSLMCLYKFCLCVTDLYQQKYLRNPTAHDIQRLYEHHEKHGFKGMLGSIDCMHWE
ncbi:uncharacterized protein [Rutidosis leptorrhynchoides]|uniref:uncharacterized protein n=1 Tax=Rutidosis leptorrhynchoides TaxID=125765 RepID=UPI003A98ED65